MVIDDFSGLSGGALWEDLKLAAGHVRAAVLLIPGSAIQLVSGYLALRSAAGEDEYDAVVARVVVSG